MYTSHQYAEVKNKSLDAICIWLVLWATINKNMRHFYMYKYINQPHHNFFLQMHVCEYKKRVQNETFWTFFLQKHKVPIAIDTWVNLEQFWIGLWGSKIALKSSKMKKWPKTKNSKNWYLGTVSKSKICCQYEIDWCT